MGKETKGFFFLADSIQPQHFADCEAVSFLLIWGVRFRFLNERIVSAYFVAEGVLKGLEIFLRTF